MHNIYIYFNSPERKKLNRYLIIKFSKFLLLLTFIDNFICTRWCDKNVIQTILNPKVPILGQSS